MRIYTENSTDEPSAEVLFNYRELKEFVDALVKFESRIKQYKIENKEKGNLGFTHLHFKDCGQIGENSKTDLIFYVDLDDD